MRFALITNRYSTMEYATPGMTMDPNTPEFRPVEAKPDKDEAFALLLPAPSNEGVP
jgi:hypothetical protein